MARARWVCPQCGKGANGPERPRKDATVRFCLACSASSPVLVERVSPRLERRRQEARLRSTTQRQREAERERERETARYSIEVVDADGSTSSLELRSTLARMVALPEIAMMIRDAKGHGARWRRARGWMPRLTVHVSDRSTACSGHAAPWSNAITLTVARAGLPREQVEELVLHELVHIVSGEEEHGKKWHGPRFQATVLRAARELWPGLPTANVFRGAYALDAAIWKDARAMNEREVS